MKTAGEVRPQDQNGTSFFLPDSLWGVLYYITDGELWDDLIALKYPSLFEYKTYRGILVGPASLLNHQCNSSLSLQGNVLQVNHQHVPQEIFDFVAPGFILVR